MPLLPVSLNLKNALCLVIGGGKIAHRKTVSLLECDAKVKLVAPQLNDAFEPLRSRIDYLPRAFHPDDCKDARLIFACTNDNAINLQVAKIAEDAGIWCNVCDDAGKSTFHSAACLRQGEITIGINTSGQSPALARHLKTRIEACIGPEYGELAKLLARYRKTEDGKIAGAGWRGFFESSALEKVLLLLKAGQMEEADAVLAEEMKE